MKSLATILFSLLFAGAANAESAKIFGDYIEARSGHVYTCGCLYSGEMVTAGREAILAWRVAAGEVEGTPLAGVKVAAVVVGDHNLGAHSGARRTVLYVNTEASDAQATAVRTLWAQEYGRVLGEIVALRRVPITFEKENGIWRVRIPGIAAIESRKAKLPDDAHLGSFLWYSPFTTLAESTLATALYYEYWGDEFGRRWRDREPGISGYYGSFSLGAKN